MFENIGKKSYGEFQYKGETNDQNVSTKNDRNVAARKKTD